MSVYLDHNATTPLDPRVLETMLPYLREQYGNPSSVHGIGRAARAAVDQAREQIAALVGAHPSQVIFTSGGTEANNLALRGVCEAHGGSGRLAVSAVEHASLLGPARALRAKGWQLDMLDVDAHGVVRVNALEAALCKQVALVSVMWANNETGVVQDIPAIAERVRAAGAVMHTDAVQAAGKLALDFAGSGAHLMSVSAHKMYGPKGIGALIADRSVELMPLQCGGGQERGLRAGTENVAAIVGFGAAAEFAQREMAERNRRMLALREELETGLRELPGVTLLAERADRLVNTVQISVPGIEGETLLMQLDRDGIAVSAGSACASGSTEPSHVLMAMSVDEHHARSAIRISLGKDSVPEDVAQLLASLRKQIEWVRTRVSAASW